MRILILCTGNSCRSQMAHGLLQSFDSKLEVFSAGTKPAEKVNPMAVKVMTEIGIDLAQHTPKSVNLYVGKKWDYVITVCGFFSFISFFILQMYKIKNTRLISESRISIYTKYFIVPKKENVFVLLSLSLPLTTASMCMARPVI